MKNISGAKLVDLLSENDHNGYIVRLIQMLPNWETLTARDILFNVPLNMIAPLASMLGLPELSEARQSYRAELEKYGQRLDEACRSVMRRQVEGKITWQMRDQGYDDADRDYLFAEAAAVLRYRRQLKNALLDALKEDTL